MRKTILLGILLLLSAGTYAQRSIWRKMPAFVTISIPSIRDAIKFDSSDFKALDFGSIKALATDQTAYASLAQRFENGDTTLTYTQLATLYYGTAYRPNYTGFYGENIPDINKTKRLKAGYKMCMKKLAEYPASPYFLNCAVQIAVRMGQEREIKQTLWWRLYSILSVIRTSGEGTMESPLLVLDIKDEYETAYKMFDSSVKSNFFYGKNPQGRTIEYLEVTPNKGSAFQGSEIWFDVEFPFSRLGQILGTEPAE